VDEPAHLEKSVSRTASPFQV